MPRFKDKAFERGAGLLAFAGARTTLPRVLWLAALTLIAALTWAQTASEKPSIDARRVGSRLACQCGCKDSVATCSMLECGFSKPAKENIAKMQALGMTDQQIIDRFIHDYPNIYLSPPNLFGVLIPYLGVVAGLVFIWWFIRKYRKPAPLP